MNTEKPYRTKSGYSPDKINRPRRSAHSSRLPYWIAKRPLVQKFRRLSRKRKITLVGWTGTSFLVVLTLATTVYFANTLGSKERIMNRNKTGVTLLDQNNQPFYTFYNARSNTYVPLEKIAEPVKKAAIASEDKEFYNHSGFSPRGIANAIWQNIRPGGLKNGGSTITQQLIGTAVLSEERSYIKKYQELVLSVEIERRYSKDEILEMYLNSVYFGEGSFGIQNAAETYFNKSAENLNTAEASLLIGLLPAPSAYSPISGDATKAKVRQNYVLVRMSEDNYISKNEATALASAPLTYNSSKKEEIQKAPHFALMVKDELDKRYGEEKVARSGYTVQTSLNLDWQTKAEAAVNTQLARLSRSNVSNAGVVITDPKTGQIRALVGSRDWNNEEFGKFNIATATRQPGSSFKPLVYATGIENRNFSAATVLKDKATDFGGGYSPKNYDLKYRGDVTVRRSLANSLNVPAVEALQKAGIARTINTAENMGITTLDKNANYGLSMALGVAPAKLTEMTNLYATFANQGKLNDITLIESINDKNNNTIFTHKPQNKQVISAQTSYIISSMLSDNVARSELMGSSLTLSGGRLAAVKTGTTEDYRDAWTIGYTPSLAIGVWAGNNDNSPMRNSTGSGTAAPIWRSLMQDILKGTPNETFTVPADITSRAVCRSSGALAQTAGSNTVTEYFRPGTLPTTRCNEQRRQAPVVTEPEEDTTEDTPANLNSQNQNNQGNGNGNGNSGNNNGNSGPGSTNPGGGPNNPPSGGGGQNPPNL